MVDGFCARSIGDRTTIPDIHRRRQFYSRVPGFGGRYIITESTRYPGSRTDCRASCSSTGDTNRQWARIYKPALSVLVGPETGPSHDDSAWQTGSEPLHRKLQRT